MQIRFTDESTTLLRSWCTQENWYKAGMRISRHCGLRRWTRQISGIGVIGGVTRCLLLSALVERSVFSGGPPLTKRGACSKPAKTLAKFLRDLGKDHRWSTLCVHEFTSPRRLANWSPRRLRDTWCLQRLHAWSSDAWRSQSQLTTRHVTNGAWDRQPKHRYCHSSSTSRRKTVAACVLHHGTLVDSHKHPQQ